MYKHKLVLFCKTCIRDIENFKILLSTIQKFNVDKIPVCISISKQEANIIESVITSVDIDITIFYDEDLVSENRMKYTKKFDKDWFSQQLVKLNLYKTNFAEHYVVIDSDCYFIKEFTKNDFISEKNIPYISVADREKGEKLLVGIVYHTFFKNKSPINDTKSIQRFFGRKGPSIFIDMPFVYTSDYMYQFEQYIKEKDLTMNDLLKICPYEMMWYLEYIISAQLPFIPCGASFVPIHIEVQYQILRLLGCDEEFFKYADYIGICMNKGYVKQNKYKGLWFGKFFTRNLIYIYYKFTRFRYDYKEKISLKNRIFSTKLTHKKGYIYKNIIILGFKLNIKYKRR